MNSLAESIQRLVDIMAKLRDPVAGCPWDREQTWTSLLSYTLEEAYEVADAIERQDWDEIPAELGDLLFQVIFYCQIAREEQRFEFEQVVTQLCDKLERRHPHVFGSMTLNKLELEQVWHQSKADERKDKALHSVLDDVPLTLPALTRAQKLQRRAANDGFDWPATEGVIEKLKEEVDELEEAIANDSADEIEEELGDLFFSLVNLARHLEVDSESCLRRAAQKFENRYRAMETQAAIKHENLRDMSLEQLESYWQDAKQRESEII